MLVLFLSLIGKWARRGNDTAFYFSGASIGARLAPSHQLGVRSPHLLPPVALVICAALYITVTLPSVRHIAK